MLILRLSEKLKTKIKAEPLGSSPLHEKSLADWSAHLFVVGHTQYILLSNTISLYSTVMYAKGSTNDSHFIEAGLRNLRESMADAGHVAAYTQCIGPTSGTVRFAKALDRTVTGSMTDLIHHATAWLAEGDLSPHDVGHKLNDILLSALAQSTSATHGTPREAFQALLEADES